MIDDNLILAVKMQFGSHVYGTNLPTSDNDYKGIYIPKSRDILLQQAKGSLQHHSKQDENAKNTAEDIDIEIFSLHKYLNLLMEGQTIALDMLFTPPEFWFEDIGFQDIWQDIVYNKERFLHKGVSSFAGYCRTQANKYGIKGSRMRAVKESVDFLNGFDNTHKRLNETVCLGVLKDFANDHEYVDIVKVFNKPQQKNVEYFEVIGRKFELTLPVSEVLGRLESMYDSFGERARLAERNEGVDWKALMHAVRVQEEAKELLSTGNITFPRPEKELLLKIRKGEMAYKKVAELIENGLEQLDYIQKTSILPDKPDREFAEDLIVQYYQEMIQRE
jgi:hypothetical protein